MRTHRMLAAAAGAWLALAAVPAPAQTHQEGAISAHKLQLNSGKKWATDEPLRAGMQDIRGLLAASEPAIRQGKLPRADYAALGARIEERVAYIVANCKLDPRADENLHIVIAEMLAGADAMQGKNRKAGPRAGARKVAAALNAYGRYFDHPGWKGL